MVTAYDARWCGTHPGRSHRCVEVNPPHGHPEFKRFFVSVRDAMYFTSEAAWDSRALNGDGQCWLSVTLLCQGTSTAA